jgi:hypothetical protein
VHRVCNPSLGTPHLINPRQQTWIVGTEVDLICDLAGTFSLVITTVGTQRIVQCWAALGPWA